MRTYSLLVLTAALCLAACDSGEADEPLVAQPGRFSADVTIDGRDRFSFDGLASATNSGVFVIDSAFVGDDSLGTIDSVRTAFMISLGAPTVSGPGHFISLMREGERPAPGTYALGGFDREGFFGFFSTFDRATFPNGGTAFVAESGTVTVTMSSDGRVAGRFEFLARSFGFGQGDEAGQTATVRGAFDAQIRALPEGFPRGMSEGDLRVARDSYNEFPVNPSLVAGRRNATPR